MKTKTCTKCEKEYPATTDFFYAAKGFRDNLRSDCKQCNIDRSKRYYQKNYKSCLLRDKKYYQENQERCRKSRRQYYYADHKKSLQHGKKYYSTIRGYLKRIYGGMKRRCNNSGCHNYSRYGGRGIECKFTSDEFVDYVINILQVDPHGLQIDRIDNDGHYEPGNIRFVTAKVNCANRERAVV